MIDRRAISYPSVVGLQTVDNRLSSKAECKMTSLNQHLAETRSSHFRKCTGLVAEKQHFLRVDI